MAFERIQNGNTSARSDRPALSFYPSGRVRFNKASVEKFFDDVGGVQFYFDAEDDRLGVALTASEADGHSTSGDGPGFNVSARSMYNEIGVDWTDLSNTVAVELEHHPDEGLLVCDLAPLREALA